MRLIDADALMKLARNYISRTVDCNDIARFPTIEAEPVVHAHWEVRGGVPYCSACGETLKKHHERMLHWWKNQKPYKKGYEHCDPMYIHSKCSYHGAAIQYCEDAIKALQEPVRHGELISTGFDEIYCEWGNCSNCGADNMMSSKRCCECGTRFDGRDDKK